MIVTGATPASSVPAWKKLSWVPGVFAVCRLPPQSPLPAFPKETLLYSATRTDREVSIVCEEAAAPAGAICEYGWRALRLAGPIPFTVTGVIAAVSAPLARARLSMFVFSTYDTDYVLVRASDAQAAREALESDGFQIEP
ncbi:MAG: ACT domain-containing protein [Acidobacteria bacterium]|nr:ACT domain-containing protein [Acidobacteriota bacterium]MCA1610182.1 ACT domain-containing protein [Acidobacteriota bacterium]